VNTTVSFFEKDVGVGFTDFTDEHFKRLGNLLGTMELNDAAGAPLFTKQRVERTQVYLDWGKAQEPWIAHMVIEGELLQRVSSDQDWLISTALADHTFYQWS
jgi:hypothetical protein